MMMQSPQGFTQMHHYLPPAQPGSIYGQPPTTMQPGLGGFPVQAPPMQPGYGGFAGQPLTQQGYGGFPGQPGPPAQGAQPMQPNYAGLPVQARPQPGFGALPGHAPPPQAYGSLPAQAAPMTQPSYAAPAASAAFHSASPIMPGARVQISKSYPSDHAGKFGNVAGNDGANVNVKLDNEDTIVQMAASYLETVQADQNSVHPSGLRVGERVRVRPSMAAHKGKTAIVEGFDNSSGSVIVKFEQTADMVGGVRCSRLHINAAHLELPDGTPLGDLFATSQAACAPPAAATQVPPALPVGPATAGESDAGFVAQIGQTMNRFFGGHAASPASAPSPAPVPTPAPAATTQAGISASPAYQPQPQDTVRISGVGYRPEMNGKTGIVESVSPDGSVMVRLHEIVKGTTRMNLGAKYLEPVI